MMKKSITIVLLVVFFVPHICFSQRPRIDISGDYLLKTKWDGSKPFNIFAPSDNVLGCHSVALAQILYFHKLSPSGNVNYVCKNGTQIDEDLSNYTPAWELFAGFITDSTKQESVNETAKYLYYVASIVKKDFGTDNYIKCSDYHKTEIENHFNCQYTPYDKKVDSNLDEIFLEEDGFNTIIREEIDSDRPIGLYYTNNKGNGHAVVLDGYVNKNDEFFVHANFGWAGKSDGWYLINADLPKDTKLLLLLTVVPK